MARKLNGIELTRYDDLFKTDAEREADQQERVQIVPAEQVFPYARQPYSVDRPSADLVRLMDSIERTGIAEPLIVRPRSEGGYEIISGHRRDYCAKVVGLDTRPVIVRDYSDEDADILVVDYNINRENLLPSEKAKAYKLKLDASRCRLPASETICKYIPGFVRRAGHFSDSTYCFCSWSDSERKCICGYGGWSRRTNGVVYFVGIGKASLCSYYGGCLSLFGLNVWRLSLLGKAVGSQTLPRY